MTESESNPTPTTGMTTKVVKGSIWTLAGTVLPFGVSFFSTPFVIRFLGTEAYGILILVSLIPTYFSFADLGMGMASTKFGSEAFGKGDSDLEGRVVRTATFVTILSSAAVMIPIVLFAEVLIRDWFKVGPELHQVAVNSLRVTAVAFVFGLLSSVVNTPMLARLRMDLNTLVNATPKVLMGILTPVVLYLGGSVVEAVWVAFAAALTILIFTAFFSARLAPTIIGLSIDGKLFRPLLRFGSGWLIAMFAAILLTNAEKFLLARYVSVQSLAFYSVAFTFANMATVFSVSMTQSLIPAFSQMQSENDNEQRNNLFSRGMRLNLIWLLPALLAMFVVARPFFTIWAGADFGRESTLPFYVLLGGLFFNILAYIPHSAITATGRTDVFAKLYWIELAIYILLAFWLVNSFGIIGAAAAWSIRVILDAGVIVYLANRLGGIRFDFVRRCKILLIVPLLFAPAITTALIYPDSHLLNATVTLLTIAVYSFAILIWFVDDDERKWILSNLRLPHLKR